MICPGGLEHGGGIGRQMGYFLEALRTKESGLCYHVLDSRGERFLGASRSHIAMAVATLAICLVGMTLHRMAGQHVLAHVNITGRGSTLRKTVLLLWAQCIRMPYVIHVHDYDYSADYLARGRVMRAFVRKIFRGAGAVLVLGEREKIALQNLLGLGASTTAVLHNAVPDPKPTVSRRSPSHTCNILFLGHLTARKGVPELLRALAYPNVMSRDWHATLAGGADNDGFQRMAGELGLGKRTRFPGWLDQSEVRGLFAEGDILVLPSYAEGLAMALLEGISHGLTVVTTPVGAHSEVIEDNVSGLLVPPGNVDALAAALIRAIDDVSLRERLQSGARRRFLEGFEVEAYAARLIAIHERILQYGHVDA